MRTIPESDRKKLRAIGDRPLNRFCARILTEIRAKIDAVDMTSDAHEAYFALSDYMRAKRKEIGGYCIDWRRSTAIDMVMAWGRAGVPKKEEFEALSDETKKMVSYMGDIEFYEE